MTGVQGSVFLRWIGFTVNCLLHVYRGLAPVLGGLPSPFMGCSLEKDPEKGAADLRSLLRARVKAMLGMAEQQVATTHEKKMCGVPNSGVCHTRLDDVIGVPQVQV